VRAHVESCPECAEFVALLESFEDAPPLPADTIEEVLDTRERQTSRGRRKTGLIAAGLVAAAAAVALIVVAAWPGADEQPIAEQAPALLAANGVRWVEGGRLSTADEPLRLRRGDELTLALDRSTRAQVEALRDDRLALGLETGCVAVEVDPAADLAVAIETKLGRVIVQGTVFAVEITEDEVVVEVVRGTVEVESPALAYGATEVTADQSLSIRDKRIFALGGQRRAAILALLGIEIGPPPKVEEDVAIAVRAEEQGAEEQAGDKTTARPIRSDTATPAGPSQETDKPLETGEQLEPQAEEELPADDEPMPPTPGELIRVARERRLSGDWKGAAEAYQQVLSLHPNRPEAVTVLLPLGEIELEHLGRPAKALGHFTQYGNQRPNGALAEEAFYGRCSALKAMGLTEREIRALEEFLARFPRSVHAENARARLQKLIKK
jgi:ferric-dicitrate binding protein FerR (iron transport regulator)/TolA-binding protein